MMNNIKKIISLLILLLVFSQTVLATHNRAGEIVYKHVTGFTYEFTINTYTKKWN
ncbi:MAG: hypothetical protein R2801_05195 [Chitinophagales bacterium]